MKTFEQYLKEQIGLNYKQCYNLKVKREMIKDFFRNGVSTAHHLDAKRHEVGD